MKLIELFKDHEVVVDGWIRKPTYPAKYRITPKLNPRKLTLQDLQEYVANLQKKYPERGFQLKKYKNLYIITQKMTEIDEKTRKEISNLKKRLNNMNKRLFPSVTERYEKIIITQQLKTLTKKTKRKKDAIPIYIDLQNQKFYIPTTYIKTKPKLVNYIVMRTLGSLGITQSQYIGTQGGTQK